MIRIDMSEYMEQHSVSRLIGAPPGYVGFEEGGQLTEKVRRNPYSVILLDEIEKAHQRVLNVLLQVLDDGRLTDGQGRTVDFTNTIIIMTSNVGAEILLQARGQVTPEVKQQVMQMVQTSFRPEFLNRIDDIVFFHSLSQENMRAIVHVQLNDLVARLKERNIGVSLSDKAADLVLGESYDPAFGARPLRRFLEKNIVTELSKMIIRGELQDNQEVRVDAVNNKLHFSVHALPEGTKRRRLSKDTIESGNGSSVA